MHYSLSLNHRSPSPLRTECWCRGTRSRPVRSLLGPGIPAAGADAGLGMIPVS